VRGALHLKSACTYVGGNALLANRDWVDVAEFSELEILTVHESEAWGASVLLVDDRLVMPNGFPRTRDMLARRGRDVREIDLSELRKAEGGPTCLSILIPRVP
jgi:dimethylargininase